MQSSVGKRRHQRLLLCCMCRATATAIKTSGYPPLFRAATFARVLLSGHAQGRRTDEAVCTLNASHRRAARFIRRSCRKTQPRGPFHKQRGHVMTFAQTASLSLSLMAAMGLVATSVAQTPPTSDQAREEMSQQKTDPLATQSSAGEDWTMLKGHEKGYVTKQDALPNSWLALNFMACDEDRNDQVSEAEYTKCQKAHQ